MTEFVLFPALLTSTVTHQYFGLIKVSAATEAAPQAPVSIHNLGEEADEQRRETIGKSAPRTSTTAIVQSGRGSWRQRWPLRVGAATRSAERRAERQWWGGTPTPQTHPPHRRSDLAFPSDAGWVNDWCVHIHDYTTVLLSCFLAARLNNSRPLCPHKHVPVWFITHVCVAITHADPGKSPSPPCDWWSDTWDASQD